MQETGRGRDSSVVCARGYLLVACGKWIDPATSEQKAVVAQATRAFQKGDVRQADEARAMLTALGPSGIPALKAIQNNLSPRAWFQSALLQIEMKRSQERSQRYVSKDWNQCVVTVLRSFAAVELARSKVNGYPVFEHCAGRHRMFVESGFEIGVDDVIELAIKLRFRTTWQEHECIAFAQGSGARAPGAADRESPAS